MPWWWFCFTHFYAWFQTSQERVDVLNQPDRVKSFGEIGASPNLVVLCTIFYVFSSSRKIGGLQRTTLDYFSTSLFDLFFLSSLEIFNSARFLPLICSTGYIMFTTDSSFVYLCRRNLGNWLFCVDVVVADSDWAWVLCSVTWWYLYHVWLL